MPSYSKFSKRDLIKRIRQLESQLQGQTLSHSTRTDHQQMQSALIASEERMRAILHTAVEGIITIDESGLMETINPAAEKMFGYVAKELIGKNISMLMPSPYREKHDHYLASYRKTKKAKIIGIGREVVAQKKNGSVFPIDLSVCEMHLPSGRFFTGIIRDISHRKKLENEIAQVSETERNSLGRDLHDGICQHLAGIECMSQALAQSLPPRESEKALKIADLIQKAITLTRNIARGLSPLSLQADGLISALKELTQNTSELFRIQCELYSDDSILITDHNIANNLYRIAQEAISNAIKHGRAKTIGIHLAHEKGHLLLSVQDNGCGISKKSFTSKGMGLRIMEHRASSIGGSLKILKKAKGTSIICVLPYPHPKSLSKKGADQ